MGDGELFVSIVYFLLNKGLYWLKLMGTENKINI